MYAWQFAKALYTADRHGWVRFVSMQNHYNLLNREEEREMLPLCADQGVAVIPWSPLAGGLLGGALQKVVEGRRAADRIRSQVDANRAKLEAWEKLCAEIGSPPSDVALAWLLANPSVTAPIIGPRTLEQLEGAMGALDVDLTAEVRAELDRIFPGPGGAAPEAYAW
jgi:aryl-alcohol dehydrogenase-like predicted oxidoreductase